MKKSEVIYILKDMPDESSAEEIIEKILLVQKIEIGLNQIKKSDIYSESEARKKIFNATTIKTMDDAQKGVGLGKPIKDISHFLGIYKLD
ncbi:hypothetical protein ACFOG5_11070 [Pedobacter fastidiosus]|uniref:Uncharacterized protein n=1 Tax=Pedobacter fastidiosus TaxID=2765361 RepID=A0ABR7KX63_9SPHI|nr:hypothetical protein [Pedobacter fastidiosus]MBC6112342.1 hypothetical protein [Pedobacter fastidiosus]